MSGSDGNARHTPERHEAVVVGAGPAGLATAALLRKRGFEVLVLERTSAVGAAPEHPLAPRLYFSGFWGSNAGQIRQMPIHARRIARAASRDRANDQPGSGPVGDGRAHSSR